MRWTDQARSAAFLVLILLPLASAVSPESPRRLSVYSSAANYSVPVFQRDGKPYVGLLDLLDPLGKASTRTESGHWRIRFNNRTQAEFLAGSDRVKIQGHDSNLGGPFLLDDDRGLVPLTALSTILPLLLQGPATLHLSADRLFIGDVGTHFTATIPQADHPSLVLQFSSPVSPNVTPEAGGLRLTFSHDPVVSPASPTLTFGNKTIPSATYSEGNGSADIFIHSASPLVATVTRDNRTITVAAANAAAPNPGTPVALVPAPPPSQVLQQQQTQPEVPPASAPPAAPAPQVARRYFVVLDASHGGDDRGEAISGSLLEKDLTLAFSRRLREQLERLGVTVLSVRDADTTIPTDQRAAIANGSHAALYVALHASSSGHGVRLFTALLPSSTEDRGAFRTWDSAQAPFRTYSLIAAAGISSALQQQQIPARSLMAPQRPLNNVAQAALALEIAPQGTEATQLASPDYQQALASAIASGIASIRDKLGAAQ